MEIKCRWGAFVAVTSSSLFMSFVGGLIFVSASAPRRNRLCSQIRSRLLPDSDASAPRFADKDRARMGRLGVKSRVFKIQKNLCVVLRQIA